jgi:hypothetical protein
MTIELTPRTVTMVDHYAELCGMSPEEFLNAFLQEFLVARFADPQSGNAEPFLLSFTFKHYGTAERLAEWVKERPTGPRLKRNPRGRNLRGGRRVQGPSYADRRRLDGTNDILSRRIW